MGDVDILRSEGLPDASPDGDALWRSRYRSIVDLERHLHANGTRIVKVFLHLSNYGCAILFARFQRVGSHA